MALISRISKLSNYKIIHQYLGKNLLASLSAVEVSPSKSKLNSNNNLQFDAVLSKELIKENTPKSESLFSILKMSGSSKEKPKFFSTLNEIRQDLLRFNTGEIKISKDDESGIALVKLCNIDRKNALTGKMMVELSDIVDNLKQWENGKVVLFYSDGDCFCSGMDLTMIKEKSDQFGGYQMATFLQDTLNRLQALPLVTVGLIQGRAMGGGAEFITAFDFRLFSPKAEARFVHSRMGVSTGIAGGGSRLVHLIGPSLALKVLLSGEVIPARRALEIGLASAVFESEENLMEAAKDWLKPLITNRETSIVQAVKQIVHNATVLPQERALELENEIFVSVWGGPTLLKSLEENKKHK